MKKITITILLYILLITNVNALEINSKNAILYNLNDNNIIYEKNSDEQVKVASLTKIMTTIVALENITNIKEEVIVPKEAFIGLDGYVKAGFKPGEKVTYEDLLYGIMLPSGADSANAISILVSGNIDSHVEKMNKKAQELGLKNTHFSNPIGKDEDNYSTVKDMAIILKYALQNETFYKIFTTKEYRTTNNIELKSTVQDKYTNSSIDTSYILGSKTGFTDEAGYCLASISKRNNINYLLVTTKADTNYPHQITDAIKTYKYYEENYGYKKIINYNQPITTLKVKDSLQKNYKITSSNDKYLYLENNFIKEKLEYTYEGIKEITKDIKKNTYLGKIQVKYENNIIYEQEVYLEDNITYINYKLISITILLIIIFIIYKKNKR